MTAIFKAHPELFILPLAAVLIVLNIRRSIEKRQYARGFASSALTTALLLILFAMGLYPNLVLSSIDPRGHISIYQAASSDGSLRTMLLFAAIGMPLVAMYTIFMFWTFRGKVKLEKHSY
jgi:cytochrome d ubiquinol oxidase subunit II